MQKVYSSIIDDANLINSELDNYLSIENIGNNRLAEAMRYAVRIGGKRYRSFLVLEFCNMFNGKRERALPYAAAIELGHAASLVHDDMPCMDNDDERRGKPSCHIVFGDATALLTGDALLSLGFEVTVSNSWLSSETNQKAATLYARNVGIQGMCLGQLLDMKCRIDTIDQLFETYDLKTGLPIRIAGILGFLAAGQILDDRSQNDIDKYSLKLGRAYQIIDDLLDIYGSSDIIGKPVGSDRRNGKSTILKFMKKEEAVWVARELLNEASEVFSKMNNGDIISKFPLYLGKELDSI